VAHRRVKRMLAVVTIQAAPTPIIVAVTETATVKMTVLLMSSNVRRENSRLQSGPRATEYNK